MILLRPDCLVFKTTDGEQIPCSVKEVIVELIGPPGDWADAEVVRHAAEAVLHYFKTHLGRDVVHVDEFSTVLERALRGLGVNVTLEGASTTVLHEFDLRELASTSTEGFELLFFPRLRDEVRTLMDGSPQLLRFRGLRACVKMLIGARRWNGQCQILNDQIVEYLRTCCSTEISGRACGLVVY